MAVDHEKTDFEKVLSQFRSLDEDGNGGIDRNELTTLMRALDKDLWTEERIDSLMRQVDKDFDRVIQFEEFISWIFGVGKHAAKEDLGRVSTPTGSRTLSHLRPMAGGGRRSRVKHEDKDLSPVVDCAPTWPLLFECMTEPLRRVADHYEVQEEIGEGYFATVARARNKATGNFVALKTIPKDEMSKLRNQPPDAKVTVDETLVNSEAGRSDSGAVAANWHFHCSLTCPPVRRPSRLEIRSSLEDQGVMGDTRTVFFRVRLRRGQEVLHMEDVFGLKHNRRQGGASAAAPAGGATQAATAAAESVGAAATRWPGTPSSSSAAIAGPSTEKSPLSSSATLDRTFTARDAIVYRARVDDVYDIQYTVCSAELDKGPMWIRDFQVGLFSPALACEVVIGEVLNHPNIARVHDAFEDFRHIYLCMELCQGGELLERIIDQGHFAEPQAVAMMQQATNAVHYMHSRKIMHRDLKLENFMLYSKEPLNVEDNVLKIVDFGSARDFPVEGCCCTLVGAPYYVAPQVILREYDEKCDVWSLGVVAYILLSGRPPFDAETDVGIWSKVREGKYDFDGEEWADASCESRAFVADCLAMDPESRCCAQALASHCWIEDNRSYVNTAKRSTQAKFLPNMRCFWAGTAASRAALEFVAQHADGDTVRELSEMFRAMDRDNSGTLHLEELRDGLETAGMGLGVGVCGWRTWLEKTFGEGSNIKGITINYTTFLASALDRRLLQQENACWAAFSAFDRDGNGHVSHRELGEVLRDRRFESSLGVQEGGLSCVAEALELDLDDDGEIDFWEFMHHVRDKFTNLASPPSLSPMNSVAAPRSRLSSNV
eukprot:TRINITY_DN25045_c0_g1_i1.p1 TRINITY_DN25045_c0_g1~~TRINITY_DN25045_c0_g1_i1.p1  ORF type:complete len:839 (-),score=186.20 TRINITY_DN25045_c0_g1_i1:22-2511(-)